MDDLNQSDKSTDSHPSTSPAPAARVSFFSHINLRLIVLTGGGILGVFFLLILTYVALTIPATPDIGNLQHGRNERPSVFLAADGKPLGSFRQRQKEWVDLDQISPHVLAALVATEDHRFYDHNGIDVTRVFGAALQTLGGDTQGASTITQQLARNMFPEQIGRSRTITRKLKEVITALKIEHRYTKGQILETYLNTVPFLYNVTGIEMAARTYFGKPAAQLDVNESATLVGILKGTHYYNPVVNPERALKRRNLVLAQMVKHERLPEARLRALQATPLQLRFQRQIEKYDDSAPHFTMHVRRWLIDWAEQNDVDLSADGLVIDTTIDLTLQQAAARAVEQQTEALQQIADVEWSQSQPRPIDHNPKAYARLHQRIEPFDYFWQANQVLVDNFIRETPEFKKAVAGGKTPAGVLKQLRTNEVFMERLKAAKTRLEAGFVAMDPTSGEIKAWVGSRDFGHDQFDHVAQAARQPGSTFKPIVYGAALEQGLSPFHLYQDRPVEIMTPDGSLWRPTDMSGPSFQRMTLRDGLVFSKNVITVQVMQDAGLPSIVNLAQALGINRSRLDAVPSLSLGTSPVTLLEMVSVYSTIATTGEYRKPVFIKRITDRNGKVLAEFGSTPERAMTKETAVELIDMMRAAVTRGTGQLVKTRFGIIADIAGKTGTTQHNADGWFILMHPNLVAGAWVGFNDSRVTMRSEYWGQGGHNATLLIGDFFRDALKTKLIDRNARFARPNRPSLIVDGSGNPINATLPSGTGVLIMPDGSRRIIGDTGATMAQQNNQPIRKTMEGLGRFLSNLGRNPTPGETSVSSGGSTGNGASAREAERNMWLN